ncbi:hypothetical protein [Mucilaginibacter ginsenosidivorans]|uniref:tRNA (5-methylaminomethyl-2-thiouridylate)-methyltransferase n=1 Tax=Mucilaginibacter ginsenosidivorans TaxID=398053 RepID=A0A5B8UTR2_9SPHI|nr:hypothetical protein [Mucilaginibacter ginsenosidivorans]QEC62292.1 hypothetical protein FRZ54_06745 [Mucilaginibacter ginsenosidivorans]
MQANTKNAKDVQTILRLTFGLVPIVAGADKFTNLLTNWEQYLNPSLKMISPVSSHTFMMIVGVIEITAGIIVLIKPQIGSWIVSAWLVLIALTLIVSGSFLDVAVRDLVMAIGAFSLGKLSTVKNLKTV